MISMHLFSYAIDILSLFTQLMIKIQEFEDIPR